MPYDQFVRELLTASGSNFRVPPVNFYRAIQSKEPRGHRPGRGADLHGRAGRELAGGPAGGHGGLLLAGRLQADRASGRRRSSSSTPTRRPADGRRPGARPSSPTARRPSSPPDQDPREVFADWLIAPENPWFARNIVNRVWSWLLGRGIIHEPDDIRPDNPPQQPRAAGLPGAGAGRGPTTT